MDFREPGLAVSTGVRGKKFIVAVHLTLSALDHGVASKGSFTPSVCLEVDISEIIGEPFYKGQVYFTI